MKRAAAYALAVVELLAMCAVARPTLDALRDEPAASAVAVGAFVVFMVGTVVLAVLDALELR